jgi:nitrate reductase gamma subunit
MTGSEFIFYIFPYSAVGLFLLGTAWRITRWLRLPSHVKWTLYPIPEGLADQLQYMAWEIFTFETLYRFNRRLWFGTYALHMAMGGLLLFLLLNIIGWVSWWLINIFLCALLVAAAYIIGLRIADRNLRVLSSGEEFFNLGFLALIAVAGLLASAPYDGFVFRNYLLGLIMLKPDVTFLLWNHLPAVLLGGLFLIYLPWSKMIHYVGKYFTYHRIKWQKHEYRSGYDGKAKT